MQTDIKLILNSWFFSIFAVLSLGGSFAAFAQHKIEEPRLTVAEKKQAREFTAQFAIRFSQTKNLAPLLKEFFSENFIETFKKEALKEATEEGIKDASAMSGFYIDARLLKELSSADWQNLCVSTNNFLLSTSTYISKTGLKHKGKNIDDDYIEKMFSPKLRNLFAQNPHLIDIINYQGNSKTISSIEELRLAVRTLEQGTEIFTSENEIELTYKETRILLRAYDSGHSKMRVEIAEDGDYGIEKGTRLISLLAPNGYWLTLAKKDGNFKIVWAVPYAE